jgi:hypothetical protein
MANTSGLVLTLVAVPLLVTYCLFSGGESSHSDGARSAPKSERRSLLPKVEIDHSPETQTERDAWLASAQKRGLFVELHVGEHAGALPKLRVHPESFAALRPEDREALLGVVYARCFDGSSIADHVVVQAWPSLRRIATYEPLIGGLRWAD